MDELQRDIGKLEAKVEALEKSNEILFEKLDKLQNILTKKIEEQNRQVQDLKSVLTEAKGGWKVILMIAGVAGTIGAGLAKILPFLSK
jgi:predicted RNase H-like nuclease (RuvC/YqgF family)